MKKSMKQDPLKDKGDIPEQWRYVERHVPGCYDAWQTLGLSSEGVKLGVTGRPSRIVAFDAGCYQAGHIECRCRQFADGVWSPLARVVKL